MKINSYHIFLGVGLLIIYLSYLLVDMFYYECFICHGIAPTFNKNLFCLGIQIVPIIGLVLIGTSVYMLVKNKLNIKGEIEKCRVDR